MEKVLEGLVALGICWVVPEGLRKRFVGPRCAFVATLITPIITTKIHTPKPPNAPHRCILRCGPFQVVQGDIPHPPAPTLRACCVC